MGKRLTQIIRDNRKFAAWWFAFGAATILLLVSKLTGDQWVNIVSVALGAYMVGNVGEHFSKREVSNVTKNNTDFG